MAAFEETELVHGLWARAEMSTIHDAGSAVRKQIVVELIPQSARASTTPIAKKAT